MMVSILKTINSVSSTNYLCDKFLSASAWSSLSSLQKALPDNFTLSVLRFHSSREVASKYSKPNSDIPHALFLFRMGIKLLNLAWTGKKYINIKTILGSVVS